jgi:hypothetical protein
MQNQNLSGYVEIDCGHVGGTDVPLSQILGLMVGEGNGHRYMAFLRKEQPIAEIREATDEQAEQADVVGIEAAGEDGIEAAGEHAAKPSGQTEPCEVEAETGTRTNGGAATGTAVRVIARTDAGAKEDKDAEVESENETAAGTNAEIDEVEAEAIEFDIVVTEEAKCRRISPRELSCLGRRGRRLMNNSFLLHGYYSYHHLLLWEHEDHYVLGVPGLFMEKEKHAAELFGFTCFQKLNDDDIIQSKHEPEDRTAFGYWCRFLDK